MDLRVENDTQRKVGDLSVNWTLFGSHDQVRPDRFVVWAFFYYYIFFIFYYTYKSLVCCVQVRIQGTWTLVSRQMDSLEQKQPFISTLAQFHIHALSHGPNHKHDSNNQVHSYHSQTLSITEFSNPTL